VTRARSPGRQKIHAGFAEAVGEAIGADGLIAGSLQNLGDCAFAGRGISFGGNHLRVYARVFTRDIYQFGWSNHRQAGPQEAAFVLTLWSGDERISIYNSMTQRLGNFVESAIIDQDIEISNP
jgi:hypothetical protein